MRKISYLHPPYFSIALRRRAVLSLSSFTPAVMCPRSSINIARTACLLALAITLLVMTGWLFHIEIFTSFISGLAVMQFKCAIAFLFACGSLYLQIRGSNKPDHRIVAQILAFLVALIGLAVCSQYLLGWTPIRESFFFQEQANAADITYPGRMAPATAVNFLLLGLGLWVSARQFCHLTQALTLLVTLSSVMALLGYIYGVESLYRFASFSSVALPTTLAFLCLCTGLFFLHADTGFMKILLSDSPGGLMARRVLPLAICTLILLGLLRLTGQRLGWYDTEIGLSLMMLATMVAISTIILWNAASLYRLNVKRQKAEEALCITEQRYRDLFENANDIIYINDLEGNFLSANKMTERLTGYRNEEVLRMNLSQIVAPEFLEIAQKNLSEKLLERAESTIYKLEIICKDGHRLPVEVSSRLIYEDGKAIGVQGIARDTSERTRLEDHLRQAQKMESIGRLAGGVAHDFNNLLTAIIGYSQLAQHHLNSNQAARNDIAEIEKAGHRAAELTNQLLAFSRKQVLQPKVLNLNQVVNNIEKMLRRLIGENIDFQTHLAAGLGQIKADPGQVEQIIMNLAVNAHDAMPQAGTLTIETANVELGDSASQTALAVSAGAYVMLAVSDTGIGMDKETQEKIFEPFFTTKEAGKGTGLGLATVYGIVKQSGGNIFVYSEPGKGTTFKIYFPQVEEEAADETIRDVNREALCGNETILLVEDETAVRKLTRQALERNGYTVLEAGNAAEALHICKTHNRSIHLVITDMVMPGISGRELAQQLLHIGHRAKVLYMSGYTDHAIVHQGALEANLPFLQKPFTPDGLCGKVREVLTRRSAAS